LKAVRAAIATHLPNRELRTALLTLIDEAQGDVEGAPKCRGMVRRHDGSGVGLVQRRTTVLMLLLGFVVAAILNADTINIANTLAPRRRAAVLAGGRGRTASQPPLPTTATGTPEQVDAQTANSGAPMMVNALGLPIGWARHRTTQTIGGVFGHIRDFMLKLVDSRDRLRSPRALFCRPAQQVHGHPLDGEAGRRAASSRQRTMRREHG
jgi:hypothetical protein